MTDFIKATLIRALYTAAEAALGVIGYEIYLQDVNWAFVLSASALAAIVSILKSIVVGLPEVDDFDERAGEVEEDD